jgi:lipopolysaccharide export LptBFGC system permease protein LptF
MLLKKDFEVFYFAKSLQAAAMAVTALALFVGFREGSMTKELTMLGIGVVIFVVGRLVEQYAGRS